MLRIGICDDEKKMEDCIEAIKKLKKEEYQTHRFPAQKESSGTRESPDIILFTVEKRKFDKIVKRILEQGDESGHIPLIVKTGNSYHSIPLENILYAENNGRKIVLHTDGEILEFYGKMNDLEEELGAGFFRCHRGYLVSMAYVSGYDSGNIYLKNGDQIYLAKRKFAEFAKEYRRYLKKNTS